jgi:hypothetical protein
MLVPGVASAAFVFAASWLAQPGPAPSWLAQAEPAPPEEPPPVSAPTAPPPAPPIPSDEEPPPLRPINTIAVYGRVATRPTGPSGDFPRVGFSLGGTFEHRYAGVSGTFAFGLGVDFFFDHFATGSTQNSFVALQTVSLDRLPVRPWLAVGAGIAVASDTRPVVRGALGLELPFSRANSIAVRADLTHALSGDRAFADLLDVGLGLIQHF